MLQFSKRTALSATVTALGSLLAACQPQGSVAPSDAARPRVEVVQVQMQTLPLVQELPGRLASTRVAEVRARVAGIVVARHFQEGTDVKAGQLLFSIDSAPFRVALNRAEAELAKAEAALADAEGVLRRYQPLVKANAISQQEFDAAATAVKTQQANRLAAKADVESAQLNLAHCEVRAPIAGRIGRALVSQGALVGQGEATAMANIQQWSPIYVDFVQPVAEVVQLREAQASQPKGHQPLPRLQIKLEGSDRLHEGRLLFSDITVDPSTSQVSLRGEIANTEGVLMPGMYVRVRMAQRQDSQAVLLPQRAVKPTAEGLSQVQVLGADDQVEARTVQTGAMYGANWHITQGLRAGEKVIVGGQQVRPGELVNATSAAASSAASVDKR
ncbi:efflux RND transporter periplasmic adaptor subunit [Curvibacter sp. RS43]|uniref:efflux RND transporter periplasmic adaptor subunit n=1 Tax=Curvibacter microcysteis TaxID=3026419 RepID=UPI00235ED8D9|nr:efflux RND transporter periplasmic adaptor subunit [Curvibacter sp. RS43]MDD0809833.1 efflux RND transporter periplasmic adaptor subunit [Curvibacter sp. RS43]